MNTEQVLRELKELPPHAQQEVTDFIAFLRQRYQPKTTSGDVLITDEPFIGMWSERADMEDSSKWVQTVRTREWK